MSIDLILCLHMDELTRKKRSRKALRIHLHKLSNEINNLLVDFDPLNKEAVERLQVLNDSYVAQIDKIEKTDNC